MSNLRIAVLQFPGVNCENETVRALDRVGLTAEIVRWTRPARDLKSFAGFVLPGGFSYQDRVRAGALAAKSPLMETLAEEADRGKPVLGICNGAQVLVEAGLVPGEGEVELAIARNRMTGRGGYYARWVMTRVERSQCVFTRHLEPGTLLPMPIAHGEGRFTARSPRRVDALVRAGRTPLRYTDSEGEVATEFPDNPNGSRAAVAAVCNARGNVLAMMPHPERSQDLGSIARTLPGGWSDRRAGSADPTRTGAPAPGMALFDGLRRHLEAT